MNSLVCSHNYVIPLKTIMLSTQDTTERKAIYTVGNVNHHCVVSTSIMDELVQGFSCYIVYVFLITATPYQIMPRGYATV